MPTKKRRVTKSGSRYVARKSGQYAVAKLRKTSRKRLHLAPPLSATEIFDTLNITSADISAAERAIRDALGH